MKPVKHYQPSDFLKAWQAPVEEAKPDVKPAPAKPPTFIEKLVSALTSFPQAPANPKAKQ